MTKCLWGFTLLEMLLVLAILSAVSWAVIPFLNDQLRENRAELFLRRLTMAIFMTRSEAMQRGTPLQFCGSSDQKTCDGRWQDGQIIAVRSSGQVVQYYQALPTGYRLIWRSSFGRNEGLIFTAEGFTHGQQGTFYYCPPRRYEQHARGLVVLRSGRVRVLRKITQGGCDIA